jgi:hypothetical protein
MVPSRSSPDQQYALYKVLRGFFVIVAITDIPWAKLTENIPQQTVYINVLLYKHDIEMVKIITIQEAHTLC